MASLILVNFSSRNYRFYFVFPAAGVAPWQKKDLFLGQGTTLTPEEISSWIIIESVNIETNKKLPEGSLKD